jgi:hypothetical protein
MIVFFTALVLYKNLAQKKKKKKLVRKTLNKAVILNFFNGLAPPPILRPAPYFLPFFFLR